MPLLFMSPTRYVGLSPEQAAFWKGHTLDAELQMVNSDSQSLFHANA